MDNETPHEQFENENVLTLCDNGTPFLSNWSLTALLRGPGNLVVVGLEPATFSSLNDYENKHQEPDQLKLTVWLSEGWQFKPHYWQVAAVKPLSEALIPQLLRRYHVNVMSATWWKCQSQINQMSILHNGLHSNGFCIYMSFHLSWKNQRWNITQP